MTVLIMSASAQTVRLGSVDGYVVAHLTDRPVKGPMHGDRSYHWVRAQAMQVTQGGAGGTLLHGPYQAYHPNGQLREQGGFDRGLKDGEWRLWTPEGGLVHVQRWKAGRLHGVAERYAVADTVVQERYRKGVLVKEKERKERGARKEKKQRVKEVSPAEKGAAADGTPAERGKEKTRKERPPRAEKGARKRDAELEKKKDPGPGRDRRHPKKDESP